MVKHPHHRILVRFDNSSGMTFADLAQDLGCTETEAEAQYEQWMTDENRRGWYGRPTPRWVTTQPTELEWKEIIDGIRKTRTKIRETRIREARS